MRLRSPAKPADTRLRKQCPDKSTPHTPHGWVWDRDRSEYFCEGVPQ